jgi:hypothetical protein
MGRAELDARTYERAREVGDGLHVVKRLDVASDMGVRDSPAKWQAYGSDDDDDESSFGIIQKAVFLSSLRNSRLSNLIQESAFKVGAKGIVYSIFGPQDVLKEIVIPAITDKIQTDVVSVVVEPSTSLSAFDPTNRPQNIPGFTDLSKLRIALKVLENTDAGINNLPFLKPISEDTWDGDFFEDFDKVSELAADLVPNVYYSTYDQYKWATLTFIIKLVSTGSADANSA